MPWAGVADLTELGWTTLADAVVYRPSSAATPSHHLAIQEVRLSFRRYNGLSESVTGVDFLDKVAGLDRTCAARAAEIVDPLPEAWPPAAKAVQSCRSAPGGTRSVVADNEITE